MTNVKSTLWTRDFTLITMVNFFLFFGFLFVQPTIPVHAKVLGGSDAYVGLLGALFTIPAMATRLLTGAGMDRWGRRGIVLLALTIFLATTLAYLGTTTLVVLVIVRILHGACWGSVNTAVQTAASDFIPRERFGQGSGIYALSMSVGRMAAPLITFGVLQRWGFNTVTITSSVLILIALLLSLRIEFRPLSAKAVSHPPRLSDLFESAALPPTLLIFIVNLTYGAVSGFIAIYGQQMGLANIGLYLGLFALSAVLFRPLFGRLVDRYGKEKVLYPCLVATFLGMILLARADTLFLYALSALVYGTGFAGSEQALNTWAITQADPDHLGAANATFLFGLDGGIGVGSIIAGLIAGALGYSRMYFAMAFPPLIALALALVYRWRSRNRGNIANS